jgi:hypothetical protein
MAKVLDNHKELNKTVKRNDTIQKNRDAKIRQLEREKMIRRGVPVILIFSVGAGVYGFTLGRKSGYLDGVRDGYVKGGQELMATWREYSEEMRLARQSEF